MARGNRRENIVLGDDDRWMFLHTLGEMAYRIAQSLHMGRAPYVSKLAKEMKQALPKSKKWRDSKQRIVRFIT